MRPAALLPVLPSLPAPFAQPPATLGVPLCALGDPPPETSGPDEFTGEKIAPGSEANGAAPAAAEKSEKEEPVDRSALQAALGIDPSLYKGRKFRMRRSYRRILEKGLTSRLDWRVVNRFAKAESPDDSGRLVETTRGIKHEIVKKEVRDANDLRTYGATHPSMPRGLDPRKGKADRITVFAATIPKRNAFGKVIERGWWSKWNPFSAGPKEIGASILTVDHERMHATHPDKRHPVYHVEYMDVPERGTLAETYQAIIFNLLQDEVPAHMVMLRRAEIHRLLAGDDILKSGAEAKFADGLQKLQRALVNDGKEGMRKTIADSYLQYKLAAFYFSILHKCGIREFPDIGQILDEMGFDLEGGSLHTIDAAKSKRFYNEKFLPLLKQHGFHVGMRLLAMGPGERAMLADFIGSISGGAGGWDTHRFLKDRFDACVPLFGKLMGDEVPEASEGASGGDDIERLPPIDSPPRTGLFLKMPSTPEAAADEIKIAGRFAELLWQVHGESLRTVADHPIPYLVFAERMDPASAATIYSALVKLGREKKLNIGNTWKVGYALRRFGYKKEGDELVDIAMRRFMARDYTTIEALMDRIDVTMAIEFGYFDEFKKLFEFIKSNDQEREGRYASALGEAVKHITENPAPLDTPFAEYIGQCLEEIFLRALAKGTASLGKFKEGTSPENAVSGDALVEEAIAAHIKSDPEKMKPREYGTLRPQDPVGFPNERNIGDAVLGARHFFGHLGRSIRGGLDKDHSDLAATCLRLPQFYKLGLLLIERFPDSIFKLELFEVAAENFPPEGIAEDRLALCDKYSRLLSRCERAFGMWGWSEDNIGTTSALRYAMENNFAGVLRETHLFAHHQGTQAALLFRAKDASVREKGLAALSEIPSGNRAVPNFHSIDARKRRGFCFDSTHYHLSVGRAESILGIADEIPPQYRAQLLAKAFAHLNETGCANTPVELLANLYLELAGWLGICGMTDLLAELRDRWEKEIVPKMNELLAETSDKRELYVLKSEFDPLKTRASLLIPFYHAVAGGGELSDEVARVQADSERRMYSSANVQEVLKYLSREEVASRPQIDESHVIALAREAIDRYLVEIGNLKAWMALFISTVDTLRGLKISDRELDALFVYFMDKFDPAQRLGAGDVGLREAVDAYKAFEFLLGNSRLPRAEARFMRYLRRAADKAAELNPRGNDAVGTIEALGHVFTHLPGKTVADRLSGEVVGTDENLSRAMEALDRYRHGIPKPSEETNSQDAGKILTHMEAFIDGRNVEYLLAIAPLICKTIDEEVNLVVRRTGSESAGVGHALADNDRGFPYDPMEEYEGGVLRIAFAAWKNSVTASDREMADALYSIWGGTEDARQIRGRIAFYFDALNHAGLPLDSKRKIFAAIAKTPFISSYVKVLWEDSVEDGDEERERQIYDLTTAVHLGRTHPGDQTALSVPSDLTYAAAFDSTLAERIIAELKAFEKDPQGYRLKPWDEASIFVFVENFKPEDWTIAANLSNKPLVAQWDYLLSRLAETVVLKKRGAKLKDEQPARNALKKFYAGLERRIKPYFRGHAPPVWEPTENWLEVEPYDGLRWIREFMPYMEKAKDLETALSAFDRAAFIHKRARDRLNATGTKMTEHLDGRAPQTQMAATRLFFQLPAGLQESLLKDMKGKTRPMANRKFAAETRQGKFGQVLSYWPGVPDEERAGFVHLQADVTKSDRGEFVQTLRTQLEGHDPAVVEHIIANLSDEPIGVGTVADVYKSSLPDGTPIAVKVITQSKEREFLKGVEWVKGLRGALELYRGLLSGTDEMIEVIDMYLAIVAEELDLTNEARHGRAIEKSAPEGIVIPYYFEKFDRPKAVITTLIEGQRYDTSNPAHAALAREKLFPFMHAQILGGRAIPLDLQPGNLIVMGAGTMLGIMDHGQTLYLTEEETGRLRDLTREASSGEIAQLASALEAMGKKGQDYNAGGLKEGLKAILSGGPALAQDFISKLFSICHENGLVIDISFRELGKGLATLAAATTPREEISSSPYYDEADRSALSAAIFAGDETAANLIMDRVLARIEEHGIAIGWRNARKTLSEFMADVSRRTDGQNAEALKKALADRARSRGLRLNADGVMDGRYLKEPADQQSG